MARPGLLRRGRLRAVVVLKPFLVGVHRVEVRFEAEVFADAVAYSEVHFARHRASVLLMDEGEAVGRQEAEEFSRTCGKQSSSESAALIPLLRVIITAQSFYSFRIQ